MEILNLRRLNIAKKGSTLAKLSVFWRTLKVTSNPLAALSLKRSGARKTINFRNGSTYRLIWSQFRIFRDNYLSLSKYTVTQVEDDLFKVTDKRSEVTCTSEEMPTMFEIMQDFALNQKAGFYHLKGENIALVGSLEMLSCIRELRTSEYQYDYKDKVVLDVGGFEGESAVYFWQKGAKKIVIYEPVPEHVGIIKKNVELNGIRAEIHQSGIGTKQGSRIVNYEKTDPGFGMHSSGSKTLEIQISQTSRVIDESGADIAKFDCEGGEQSLVDVPTKILQKITYYIIEVHSPQIRTAVLEKFLGSGFSLVKEVAKPPTQFSVLTFKRSTYKSEKFGNHY